MLRISDLETGYGKKQVLYGFSLNVDLGEIVALIGPNGAGKSTALKVICGLIPVWKGQIEYAGVPLNGSSPAQNVTRGIMFAPQSNRVFDELTVLENLQVGGFQLSRKKLRSRIEETFEMFPVLKGRAYQNAGSLSGGEQQMVALARTLIPRPKLLMLDEPSLGLSPDLVKNVFKKIVEINQKSGVAIVIVEQKVREVLGICHRVYSMKLGKVAFEGLPNDLQDADKDLKRLFL